MKSKRVLVFLISRYSITFLFGIGLLQLTAAAPAEQIKKKPLDDAERARIALDQAMNDANLRKGDIISTQRGFLQLRGLNEDGTYDFTPIANPLVVVKPDNRRR